MFQGQSTRSMHWFDIDINWVKEHFTSIQLQLYNRPFQRNNEDKYEKLFPTFTVPIGNAKEIGKVEYPPIALPM